jgi:hypothetical protein
MCTLTEFRYKSLALSRMVMNRLKTLDQAYYSAKTFSCPPLSSQIPEPSGCTVLSITGYYDRDVSNRSFRNYSRSFITFEF